MPKNPKHLISIIIPAYKQESTIVKDLKRIQTVLNQIRYDHEMIVIVDGRLDKTYSKAKMLTSPQLKVYLNQTHQGKGYTVRYGMSKAKGDYIAFLDAGMEIDPNGISMLLEHLEWYNADIIVGSKRHLASVVQYPLDRKILSWGYYHLVRLLFGVKIKDTQPGIKIFKRKVLERILPKLVVKKYAFDIEMLSVAHRKGFTRIFEAPIKLKYHFGSVTDAATLNTIWHMLYDTLAVFYRLKILKYYD
ncbi:MAG: glycosyltransferase family 2 protein [Candidatus Beckwithbacteria bacterium]|nr:glycosyltransferase family 2 protein [Candidatus Beckwithbacteria bacterium]